MGTAGTGLWENDEAMDRVADLVPRIERSRTAEDLAARVGLTQWLAPAVLGDLIDEGDLADLVARIDLAGLPAPVRARLRTLSKGSADDVPREDDPELAPALGSGVTGVREGLFLEQPHARRLSHELVERCAGMLDTIEGSTFDDGYEELAPLGLLALLEARVDRGRVARWRAAFDALDEATTKDRARWDEVVERVRPLFNRIATPE